MKCKYWMIIALVAFVSFPTTTPASMLGTAERFVVLAATTVTNTGLSILAGDVGVSPGGAITGFPPGIVAGTIHVGDAVALQAQSDVTTAYNSLAAMPFTHDLTGQELGGLTLPPGVYHFNTSAQLTGILTLDAQYTNNAVWVFQIGSTLTTASNSVVQVINRGTNDDVFWQVGSSATLGTNTTFEGNILASISITSTTGATILNGGAFAQNGAVTLDTMRQPIAYLLWTRNGEASVWALNSTGTYLSSRYFAPGSTWTATSYHDMGNGTARILWTRSGEAVLWTVNSAGSLLGYWAWAPGSTWTATSYYPMPDGTSRILWTKPGAAVLWTVNSTGSLIGSWSWAPGSTWTATSYYPMPNGTSRILWTKPGSAVLWTVNSIGSLIGSWSWTPGSTWTATGYQPMRGGTSEVLWMRSGTAVLWTVNSTGGLIGYWSWMPGSTWTAQSYFASAEAGGAFKADTLRATDLVVRKAGEGRGTIVAGEQTCGPACVELRIPYVPAAKATLQVTSEADSVFVGWETANGARVATIYYAQPGETVIAVFERK